MGIALSKPAPPPQCDSSPRRSPAIGSGSDEPLVSRAETQSTERRGFPLQASVEIVLHVIYTSPEQECILLQPDVGVDDEEKQLLQNSRCSRGVCETIKEVAAAAKDDSMDCRAKQEV